MREKVSTSVDLPFSEESKRVLNSAAEESERLSHKHIGTEHILLGLLREEKSIAAEILQRAWASPGNDPRGVEPRLLRKASAEPVEGTVEPGGILARLDGSRRAMTPWIR